MSDLLNATIEIQEMADKKGQYGLIKKIKGKSIETGQTNTYTVYDKKADGTTSAAWNQLQSIQVGDTVSVGYAEKSGTMDDGKPFTSRIVRNFNKDIGNGVKQYQSSQQAKSSNVGHSGASGRYQDSELHEVNRQNRESYFAANPPRNFEREAYEKCLSLWFKGYSEVAGGTPSSFIDEINRGVYWDLFQAIKKDGEKRFAKGWDKAKAIFDESLPTINQDDDPAGEINPFVNDEPPIEAYGDDIPY